MQRNRDVVLSYRGESRSLSRFPSSGSLAVSSCSDSVTRGLSRSHCSHPSALYRLMSPSPDAFSAKKLRIASSSTEVPSICSVGVTTEQKGFRMREKSPRRRKAESIGSKSSSSSDCPSPKVSSLPPRVPSPLVASTMSNPAGNTAPPPGFSGPPPGFEGFAAQPSFQVRPAPSCHLHRSHLC